MRQFVAVFQPVGRDADGLYVVQKLLVCRGQLADHTTELPRDRILAVYCEKFPDEAEAAREYATANSAGGISHIIWDGDDDEALLANTSQPIRSYVKDLLDQAVPV